MTQQITFGPYSPIRKVGNLFFVSGQVGVDPTTKTASPDVSVQVEQALINLRTVLRSADLELNDVVKTTLFLTDMGDFATVNTTYLQFFNEPRPARSTVTVAELPRLTDTPLKFEMNLRRAYARGISLFKSVTDLSASRKTAPSHDLTVGVLLPE